MIEPEITLCPCGCGGMVRIGEDRSERLDIVPAQLRVIVTVRPKYACRACEQGVVQAPAPARLIEGALPTERARVSPKSRLGEKLGYIARHWDGLRLFLADGRVEMDSNSVENLARPIALTRKNALFAGHDEGAAAWGRIASLIQTAKLNGVEPYAWLKATLEAIAAGHPNSRIDDLLPWSFHSLSS